MQVRAFERYISLKPLSYSIAAYQLITLEAIIKSYNHVDHMLANSEEPNETLTKAYAVFAKT